MKKYSKEYKKMCKKHKKLITKSAKEASTNPFSYYVGLKVFVEHLKFMQEYYALGENVHAKESEDIKREHILNMVLAEYNEWIDETCKYNFEKSIYHRKRFFELLGEYIDELWD